MPWRSWISALWTRAFSTKPCVSTRRWRLRPLDLLGPVVSTLFSSHARGLERLAVHHAGARLGVSVHAHPHALGQGGVDPLEGAVLTPNPQVMVYGLPAVGRSWGSSCQAHPLLKT